MSSVPILLVALSAFASAAVVISLATLVAFSHFVVFRLLPFAMVILGATTMFGVVELQEYLGGVALNPIARSLMGGLAVCYAWGSISVSDCSHSLTRGAQALFVAVSAVAVLYAVVREQVGPVGAIPTDIPFYIGNGFVLLTATAFCSAVSAVASFAGPCVMRCINTRADDCVRC